MLGHDPEQVQNRIALLAESPGPPMRSSFRSDTHGASLAECAS
jgi:hypothetical protein